MRFLHFLVRYHLQFHLRPFLRRTARTISRINETLAASITTAVGSMWCAYAFVVLACIGFPGWQATPAQLVQWLSQCFIQLVLLSVIMVGQSYLQRKSDRRHDAAEARMQRMERQILHEMHQRHDANTLHISVMSGQLLELLRVQAQQGHALDDVHAALVADQPTRLMTAGELRRAGGGATTMPSLRATQPPTASDAKVTSITSKRRRPKPQQ